MKRLILVIFFFICLLEISSVCIGYCNDWVYVGETIDGIYNCYYNSKNIVFYKDKMIIKVWIKQTFTQQKKNQIDVESKEYKYNADIKNNIDLFLYIYDYYNNTSQIIEYVKINNNKIKDKNANKNIIENIIPDSDDYIILNKIMNDYDIKR